MTTPWWIHAILIVLPFLIGFISAIGYGYGRRTIGRLIFWMLFAGTLSLLGILLANAATGTPSLSPLP